MSVIPSNLNQLTQPLLLQVSLNPSAPSLSQSLSLSPHDQHVKDCAFTFAGTTYKVSQRHFDILRQIIPFAGGNSRKAYVGRMITPIQKETILNRIKALSKEQPTSLIVNANKCKEIMEVFKSILSTPKIVFLKQKEMFGNALRQAYQEIECIKALPNNNPHFPKFFCGGMYVTGSNPNNIDRRRLGLVMQHYPGNLLDKINELINSFAPTNDPKENKEIQEKCLKYASGIIEAIFDVHASGIIHKDVKAENFLISETDEIVLIDYGYSCLTSNVDPTCCGSPAYVAPELIQYDSQVSFASDNWSMGYLLFWVLQPLLDESDTYFHNLLQGNSPGYFTHSQPQQPTPESNNLYARFIVDLLQIDPSKRPSDIVIQERWKGLKTLQTT